MKPLSLEVAFKANSHRSLFALFVASCLLGVCLPARSEAQLFGSRSVSRPVGRQINNSQAPQAVGSIQGNERFLRGRRSRSAFVGADQAENIGFVGLEQGRTSGRIASPTGGLTPPPDRTSQINRPIPTLTANEPYPARIVLGSTFNSDRVDAGNRLSAQFEKTQQSLQQTMSRVTGALPQQVKAKRTSKPRISGSIDVTVSGRKAILQGEVASAKSKNLAEILALFEPGIDEVQNDLRLRPSSPNSQ